MYYVMILLCSLFIHGFCNIYSNVHCRITFEVLIHILLEKQPTSQSTKTLDLIFVIWESGKDIEFEHIIHNDKFNEINEILNVYKVNPL